MQHEEVSGAPRLLELAPPFPISETGLNEGSAPTAGPCLYFERCRQGLARRLNNGAAVVERGFDSMPRMTLLDGSLFLSLSAPRGPSAAGKAADAGYPPYNIELLPEEPQALRITLAVAGFGPEDLEVSVEDGELSIRGKQREEQTRDYLHRGIAARQFKRSFHLASGVEVGKAELDNGLLVIELSRPRDKKRVMKIGISAAN